MSKVKAPREFWIAVSESWNHLAYSSERKHDLNKTSGTEKVRVIEYSAYEKLQTQAENLADTLRTANERLMSEGFDEGINAITTYEKFKEGTK